MDNIIKEKGLPHGLLIKKWASRLADYMPHQMKNSNPDDGFTILMSHDNTLIRLYLYAPHLSHVHSSGSSVENGKPTHCFSEVVSYDTHLIHRLWRLGYPFTLYFNPTEVETRDYFRYMPRGRVPVHPWSSIQG